MSTEVFQCPLCKKFTSNVRGAICQPCRDSTFKGNLFNTLGLDTTIDELPTGPHGFTVEREEK